jgi:hypothetical protein
MKGRKAAFTQLGVTLAIMFFVVALARQFAWLDWVGLAFLIVASVIVLWRILSGSMRTSRVPTWLDALPEKWRKKVLGEDAEKP